MSNNEIDTDIIIELTNNENCFISYNEMYNLLINRHDNNIHFRNELLYSFIIFSNKYDNVKYIVQNNEHYLMWSNSNKNNEPDQENCKKYNYIALIEYMITNEKYKFNPYLTLDGINNAIHISITNNNIRLLQKMKSLYYIKFHSINKNNKTCLELAKEVKNIDIVEMILNDIHIEQINTLKKQNIQYTKIIDEKNIYINNIVKGKVSLAMFMLPVLLAYYSNIINSECVAKSNHAV